MSVKKAEVDLASGETVRLCVWDPKTSLLPKETGTISRQYRMKKRRQEKGSYIGRLVRGEIFTYQSSGDEGEGSTDSEEEQKPFHE